MSIYLTKHFDEGETFCPMMSVVTLKQCSEVVMCAKECCQWWDKNACRCGMIRTPMFKVDDIGNVERMW